MDNLKDYSEIVEKILREYAAITHSHSDINRRVVIDSGRADPAPTSRNWTRRPRC